MNFNNKDEATKEIELILKKRKITPKSVMTRAKKFDWSERILKLKKVLNGEDI